MANPIASGGYSLATLSALYTALSNSGDGFSEQSAYSGSYVVIHTDPRFRVNFNPTTASTHVEVYLPDTVTGIPTWQNAVTYTAT